MSRNWLIRTTQNKILGPVSSEKLAEFVENGALTQNDEVSSGNGFWFSLKEEDLVERFIFNGEPQGFNPISECPTLLANGDTSDISDSFDSDIDHTLVIGKDTLAQLKETDREEKISLPNSDDLEFPDINVIGDANSDSDHDGVFHGKLPSDADLEYPDVAETTPVVDVPPEPPQKKNQIVRNNIETLDVSPKKHHSKNVKKRTGRSDYYLFYIFFIMIGLVVYAVYFYYSKISQNSSGNIWGDELGAIIIPNAHAQTHDVKKKYFF